jgi:4-carboxymuconolactone decarboxylase
MKQLAFALVSVWLAASALAQTDAGLRIVRHGQTPPAAGFAENFTGRVRIDRPFQADAPARAGGALVTFEAGARTAWHKHSLGQTLIVTQGVGLVQRWKGPIQQIEPGDVVWIPPGEKHWHGATPSTVMSHIAISERLDGKSVEWLEKVSDDQYRTAPSTPTESQPASQSTAQRLFGEVNPKLAQLTDDVLFGDVWKRPGLSPRDRSLVTVSALIAMNRPDQLRSHLQRARDNGVTETELVEAITHLAFYAGWPSAVTASVVAKEVFQKK